MDAPDLLENIVKILNGDRDLLEAAARIHHHNYDQMSAEQRLLVHVEACGWARACLEVAGWDWASERKSLLRAVSQPRNLQ